MQKYPDPPQKIYKSKHSYTARFNNETHIQIYTDGVPTDSVNITDILWMLYVEKKLRQWVGSFYPRTHSRKKITKDIQKVIDLTWPPGPTLKTVDREQRKKKREQQEWDDIAKQELDESSERFFC